jgi:cell division protein FtsB
MRALRYPVGAAKLRRMSARGYAAASTVLLVGTGALTYGVYGLAFAGAPHRWVVVLYAVSAAALLGALICDRWQMIHDLGMPVIARLASLLGFGLATEPENPIAALLARVEQSEQQLAELKAKLEKQKRRQETDEKRIAELETEIAKYSSPRARAVTGAVLTGLSILFGFAATVLWAANLA